jgi:hypothetical protein
MKKIAFALSLITVIFCISACDSMLNSENTPAVDNTTSQVEQTEKQQEQSDAEIVQTTAAEETETTAQTESNKEPTLFSVQELNDLLDTNATEAEKLQNTYVTVTGYVSNFDSDGSYFSLGNGTAAGMFDTILCSVENSFDLNSLEKGKKYAVTGTITSIGEIMGYAMEVDKVEDAPAPDYSSAEIVDMDISTIFDEVESNELAATKKYMNKVVRVSGVIKGISEETYDKGVFYLEIDNGEQYEYNSIRCYGLPEDVMLSLSKGENITILGICNSFNTFSISVVDTQIET